MKSNNLCPSKDYDFYTIQFPLSALKKSKRERFINSELGKLHPCFSDEWCFDSHLHLEKTGLKADVVVMQKYKLAEYRNTFKRKSVFVKECNHIPFFRISHEKLILRFAIVFVILTVLIVSVMKLISRKNENIEIEETEKLYQEVADQQYEDYISPAVELLKQVCLSQGNIISFEWKIDGFNEKINASLKNLYPEELVPFFTDATFSSLVFDNEIPVFNIELVSKFYVNKSVERTSNDSEKNDFRSELRQLLKSNHIKIVEETVNPYSLRFVFDNVLHPDIQIKALETLFDFFIDKNIYISSFTCNSKDNNLNVSICFSELELDFQKEIYKSLQGNLNLFIVKTTNRENQNKKSTVPVIPVTTKISKKELKVGQVIRSDGTIVEFVKNEDGKILQRIQQKNQEKKIE